MISIIKKPSTPASQSEGYVVMLPTTTLPAGVWSLRPVEFNVFTVTPIDGTDVRLSGQIVGNGIEILGDVTVPAGRALAFAE